MPCNFVYKNQSKTTNWLPLPKIFSLFFGALKRFDASFLGKASSRILERWAKTYGIVWIACFAPVTQAETLRFAVLGDMPYFSPAPLVTARQAIDARAPDFAIHVGDIKSGVERCDDALLEERRALFQAFNTPLIYLFGDNEWTDCQRFLAGNFDPLERLQRLRQIFTTGERSLGQRAFEVERQSAQPAYALYRENVRWWRAGVLFVGLHVVGSHNGSGHNEAMEKEFQARDAANQAWLQTSFTQARQRGARAVVLAFHADIGLRATAETSIGHGFGAFFNVLREAVEAYGKPVLLVHGDGHVWRNDHPLRRDDNKLITNLQRVATFGPPANGWAEIIVSGEDPARFTVIPHPL